MPDNQRRPTSEELVRQARERYSDTSKGGGEPPSEAFQSEPTEHEEPAPDPDPVAPPPPQRVFTESPAPAAEMPPWQSPPPKPRTRPGTIKWIIASAIFGISLVISALATDSFDTAGFYGDDVVTATDLEVGDCVLLPEGVAHDEGFTFETLDSVSCGEPHDLEVYASFEHPGGSYPGEEALFDYASDLCAGAFADYTGVAYEDEARLVFTSTVPDATAWSQSDRSVECLLQAFDGEQLVGIQAGRGLLGFPGLEVSHCYGMIQESSYTAFSEAACDAEHDIEVMHMSELGHEEGAPFPGEDWLDDFAYDRCAAEFEAYVGEPWTFQSDLDFLWVVPTSETWEVGDRTLQCFLVPYEGSPVTGA